MRSRRQRMQLTAERSVQTYQCTHGIRLGYSAPHTVTEVPSPSRPVVMGTVTDVLSLSHPSSDGHRIGDLLTLYARVATDTVADVSSPSIAVVMGAVKEVSLHPTQVVMGAVKEDPIHPTPVVMGIAKQIPFPSHPSRLGDLCYGAHHYCQ